MLKKLAKSIREYKRASILTAVLITCEVILECLIPYIIAMLVNRIKAGCGFPVIAGYGGVLFGMACLSLAFGAMAGATSATASCGFGKNLRKDLFYRVQDFAFENIDKFSASSLVTRMTTDVFNVQNAYMMIIRVAVRSPLMFLSAIIMSYVMGGKLALMFVVVVPVLAFGLILIVRKALPTFKRVFRRYDKLNESIAENVRGIRAIKSFVREDFEKEKFGQAAENIRVDFTRAERIVAFNAPLMQFCLYTNMMIVLFFGSQIIIRSAGLELDVDQFSAMLTYGFQILISLMMHSMVYVMITIADESARRIVEVLDEAPSLAGPEDAVMAVPDGSADFESVSFKYLKRAERFALSDINLKIASGRTVGILGGTGSSKSTLMQLIPRLYDATLGTVRVGGIDVKRYDLAALRDQVAVVLQKNELFSGTIRDNLRWGNPNATDEELAEACKLAQAHEFVMSFPKGYDTWIEQGGSNVSGGQKQRLCIARALLKKPKMLYFCGWLAALVLVGLAVMVLIAREVGGSSARFFVRQQVALGNTEGFVEEMMNDQKVVKVFCHERESEAQFDRINEALYEDARKANRFANMLMPILNNIGNALYVLVAMAGGLLLTVSAPNFSLSGLPMGISIVVPFLNMTKQLAGNVGQLSQQINAVAMGLAGASRVFEPMDQKSEVDDGCATLINADIAPDGTISESLERTGAWAWRYPHPDGTVRYTKLEGDVRLADVDFAYEEGKPVLEGVTVYAEPRQKVAFVGATGAGKTTITNLLNRFYDIADGKIRYDGININKSKKADLRRSLGVVLQETNLFTGTVMDNIRYGRLDATDEQCIEAAKLAGADDFITRLPDGYNTVLYSNGSNLSQGQRQLLTIARAAVADPPVMILDEATSFIDTRTEQIVQRGMDKLMEGRTVFVIAHRLSTVMHSDVIMVLEHGRIIERGSHDRLIAEKGTYYRLYTGAFELE